ncbi:hypothetical protein [Nitratireductor thuwali]|uniref:hypothetical protein n=1 Tax=Nitratireductor thuwali TaxID=2267699 RepID=UPI0030CB484F
MTHARRKCAWLSSENSAFLGARHERFLHHLHNAPDLLIVVDLARRFATVGGDDHTGLYQRVADATNSELASSGATSRWGINYCKAAYWQPPEPPTAVGKTPILAPHHICGRSLESRTAAEARYVTEGCHTDAQADSSLENSSREDRVQRLDFRVDEFEERFNARKVPGVGMGNQSPSAGQLGNAFEDSDKLRFAVAKSDRQGGDTYSGLRRTAHIESATAGHESSVIPCLARIASKTPSTGRQTHGLIVIFPNFGLRTSV